MTLKIALMNDTSSEGHFGCDRVMRTIKDLIHKRDGRIIASSPVGNCWDRDDKFIAEAESADVILINGEGTLHHGRDAAHRLLSVVNHSTLGLKPVCVVNAIYQDNPTEFEDLVSKTALFSVRDSRSFGEVSIILGPDYSSSLDYSLYDPIKPPVDVDQRASSGIIGDSVKKSTSKKLLEISQSGDGCTFSPMTRSLKTRKHNEGLLRCVKISLRQKIFTLKNRNVHFCHDDFEYLDLLGQAQRHLTGRFHAACFSLLSETPFVCIHSNSKKNEALIADVGLDPARVCSLSDIDPENPLSNIEKFTRAELLNIKVALERSRASIDETFDKIFGLAG